ncbi:MAG: DUF169 domain-containing protein [Desulfobacterales bacterium]
MQPKLEKYQSMGERLERYIRPATFPLAVNLIREETQLNFSYKTPLRDLGLQNFVCQNFNMARTYGWTMKIGPEDINCRSARALYGWDRTKGGGGDLSDFAVGLYGKDLQTLEKSYPYLYPMEEAISALVISPLCRTKIEPDVVLIYCLPAQAMRLIQGYLFHEGGALEFTAAGRTGSCHEGVTKPIITQKPQLVILGNGDRVWGGAQDSEVMFSCPCDKLEILVDGVSATHKAGLRYPIPSYMNFSPGFQKDFEQRAIERSGITLVKG